jgi:hypothetical protein
MSAGAKRLALLGVFIWSMLFASEADAKITYLLNCRLMKPNERIYARYCIGEIRSQLRMICKEEQLCLLRVAKFKSRYMKPETKLLSGSNGSRSVQAQSRTTTSSSPPDGGEPQ